MVYPEQSMDLGQLFGSALATLRNNRQSLNQADELNHDHGDNMVDTFRTITRAVNARRGAAPSEQLGHAANVLKRHPSGSAQVYAKGLAQASNEFQGQPVTSGNAVDLVQMLLGGGQAASDRPSSGGAGGILGSLFGGGQSGPAEQPQSSPAMGELLGAFLGGSQPQQQQTQADDGLDMGDLLRGGMAFVTARMSGRSNLQALVSAIVAASAMSSGYREQSGSLVASSLLSAVQSMTARR